jgi:hypothetical protein
MFQQINIQPKMNVEIMHKDNFNNQKTNKLNKRITRRSFVQLNLKVRYVCRKVQLFYSLSMNFYNRYTKL